MNLYFWQQIIKGKKYILILMVECDNKKLGNIRAGNM